MKTSLPSIILVEDNKKLAGFIKLCLEESKYDVSHIVRGDQAVYRIIKDQPDMVLLDIMLPGMDGTQICQSVRPQYTGKIIMLTALTDTSTEVENLNIGADDFIPKPIKTEVLLARISAVMRRPTLQSSNTTMTHGCLTINMVKHEVVMNDSIIKIKPSEYDLLQLLAINSDKLLTRDNISQALYGREYDGVDRGIDQKIASLRKKLGDNSKEHYRIKTMHGKGYTFISSAW